MRTGRSVALLGVAAVALVSPGCQKAAGTDPAAVTNTIKADEKKWNDQFKSKDLEGLLSHYTDDAFFAAPGSPPANGSTDIRKLYSDALTDHYFQVSSASDKIDVSGDLAYSRGHFSEQYQDRKSLKIVSDSGSYLSVYKKQADGSWKVIEEIAAADPATRKETAPTTTGPKMITSGL
jgi:ketosteroid isomerase-like protein